MANIMKLDFNLKIFFSHKIRLFNLNAVPKQKATSKLIFFKL